MKNKVLGISFLIFISFTSAFGQITLSGTAYSQNFDAIGTAGLPNGISVRTLATATVIGTVATFSNAAIVWNNTSGAFKNFASATGLTASSTSTEQNNSTNRSLGLRQTASIGDPGGAFVFQLTNTTNLQAFNLSFKIQSLDNSSPRTSTWLVDYGIGTSPASFTTIVTAPTPLVTGNSLFTNDIVTVNFGTALDNKSQNVWIRIVTLAASIGSGNRPSSSIDDFTLNYSSFADVTPPTVVTLNPAHNTLSVPISLPLQIKFSEPIQKGTGNIIVKNITDNSQQLIDVSSSTVTVNNDSAIIAATLLNSKQYRVIIPVGAFKDVAGNNFAGITEGNWNFETAVVDVTPPGVNGFIPNSGATNISLAPTLKIIFNELVQTGNNLIIVKKFSDNSTVFSVNAQTGASTNGNEGIIPVTGLSPNTLYYVQVITGAFRDLAGNNFAGFTDNTTWQFTTGNNITPYSYNFDNCVSYGVPGSGWAQYSFTGDSIWKCTTYGYNNTNGVQISGYVNATGPAVNEDWLISPSMNLSTYNIPILSFRARTKYAGNRIELLASTTYTGTGNPSAATWTPISIILPLENSDVWTLVDSINLVNFKSTNTYIAIKYTSTIAAAARWTIDDFAIRNATTPPLFALQTLQPIFNWDYILFGNSSPSKLFQFVGINFANNISITAPTSFQLSKDNISYSNSISFDPTELSAGYKAAFVRFTPFANNTVTIGYLNFNSSNGLNTNKIEVVGNSYPAASTIDIVNWNLEWFGSASNGPADNNLQQANVKRVMDSLQADIYALCEIVDTTRLMNLTNSLGGYSYKVSDYCSNAPDPSNGNYANGQKLAFIYKTASVSNVKFRGLLKSSTAASSNWASGRVPYLMEADIVNGTASKKYYFVMLHGKAGSTLSDYQRRKDGVKELKDSLDAQLNSSRVVILGDFNDDIDVTIAVGVAPPISSYDDLIKDSTDADHYKALSMPISLAGLSSTISYPEVIDHFVISNEVSQDVILRSTKLVKEVESWIPNYGSTTTDHYPVMSRLLMPSGITGLMIPINAENISLKILPNPAIHELMVSFKPEAGSVQIEILDINGKLIHRMQPYRTASVLQIKSISLQNWSQGIYILKLINNQKLVTKKFIKLSN